MDKEMRYLTFLFVIIWIACGAPTGFQGPEDNPVDVPATEPNTETEDPEAEEEKEEDDEENCNEVPDGCLLFDYEIV